MPNDKTGTTRPEGDCNQPDAASVRDSVPAVCSRRAGETLQGRVTHVVDGDTLDVIVQGKRIRVRILDIDAPEHAPTIGHRSRQSLIAVCGGEAAQVMGASTTGTVECSRTCAVMASMREPNRSGAAWHGSSCATRRLTHRYMRSKPKREQHGGAYGLRYSRLRLGNGVGRSTPPQERSATSAATHTRACAGSGEAESKIEEKMPDRDRANRPDREARRYPLNVGRGAYPTCAQSQRIIRQLGKKKARFHGGAEEPEKSFMKPDRCVADHLSGGFCNLISYAVVPEIRC